MTTAAMLVIGDEILTGKIHDKNSHTLARVMFERGVRLRRVETVPDDVDDIAASLRALAARFDHVFTSGGIGPTHDDVTYDAVAKAFDRPLELHDETWARMRAHYLKRDGDERALNDARRRMALFPRGATVLAPLEQLWVPVVNVENVYVLPGIPSLFEVLLEGLKARFTGPPIHRRLVYTWRPEGDIAAALTTLQARFPTVAIGSYPHPEATDHKGLVTLESEDERALDEATALARADIEGFDLG